MKTNVKPRMPKVSVPKGVKKTKLHLPKMPKIKGVINPYKIFK